MIGYTLTHGTPGFLLIGGLTAAAFGVGLAHGRAPLREWLLSPLTCLITFISAAFCNMIAQELVAAAAIPVPVALRIAVSLASYPLVGYFAGRYRAAGPKAEIRKRGALLHEACGRQTLRTRTRAPTDRITLAGIDIPRLDETKHFKIIGTTGTGKSTAIREVLRTALARGDRAVIADPDGAYLHHFYDPRRGDEILNPFDPRSVQWDLLQELRAPYDIDQLARALIADSADPSGREWRAYARTFLSSLLRSHCVAAFPKNPPSLASSISSAPSPNHPPASSGAHALSGVESSPPRTGLSAESDSSDAAWVPSSLPTPPAAGPSAGPPGAAHLDTAELWRLLALASADELRARLAGTPAQAFLAPENAKMFGSIRSWIHPPRPLRGGTSQTKTAGLSPNPSALNTRPGAAGGGVLFLPYTAGEIATLRSVIATWLRLAIFEAMNGPEGDQRLWVVIDELDALGAIDGLKDALARLRKFGGRCVLGFQSVGQVSATYGRGDAQTIVENCGNTLILRCSASEGGGTAQFASRLIGDREIIRTQRSQTVSREGGFLIGRSRMSTTTGEHHSTEPAVLPAEIEQLPDLSGYLKLASRPEWLKVRVG